VTIDALPLECRTAEILNCPSLALEIKAEIGGHYSRWYDGCQAFTSGADCLLAAASRRGGGDDATKFFSGNGGQASKWGVCGLVWLARVHLFMGKADGERRRAVTRTSRG
jgi:hypothetical protein